MEQLPGSSLHLIHDELSIPEMGLADSSGSNDNRLDRAHKNTPRCGLPGNLNISLMSEEERNIRDELEADIERDLEEEIKDGIYHHALRLHRLYQHKNKQNPTAASDHVGLQSESSNGSFTEVNITIKMEGGCKIEISESKTDAANMAIRRVGHKSSRSDAKQGRASGGGKRFDWSRTLRNRSGPGSPINKKHEGLDQGKNKSKLLQLGWKY